MKKFLILSLVLMLMLTGCGQSTIAQTAQAEEESTDEYSVDESVTDNGDIDGSTESEDEA